MLNDDQKIPCQLCNTPVPFDINKFLQGFSFSCPNPNCDATYSLPSESRNCVQSAITQFEKLKSNHNK